MSTSQRKASALIESIRSQNTITSMCIEVMCVERVLAVGCLRTRPQIAKELVEASMFTAAQVNQALRRLETLELVIAVRFRSTTYFMPLTVLPWQQDFWTYWEIPF